LDKQLSFFADKPWASLSLLFFLFSCQMTCLFPCPSGLQVRKKIISSQAGNSTDYDTVPFCSPIHAKALNASHGAG